MISSNFWIIYKHSSYLGTFKIIKYQCAAFWKILRTIKIFSYKLYIILALWKCNLVCFTRLKCSLVSLKGNMFKLSGNWHFNRKTINILFSKYSGNLHRSNSQILVTWNFSTNHDFVPWIGEKLHIGEEFQQFSRNNMYVRVPGKLSEIHSKVLVFSNPGDNIQFLV